MCLLRLEDRALAFFFEMISTDFNISRSGELRAASKTSQHDRTPHFSSKKVTACRTPPEVGATKVMIGSTLQ